MSIGLVSHNSTCLWIIHKSLRWLATVVFQWLGEASPIPLLSIDTLQINLVIFLVSFLGLLFIPVALLLESLPMSNTFVYKIKV